MTGDIYDCSRVWAERCTCRFSSQSARTSLQDKTCRAESWAGLLSDRLIRTKLATLPSTTWSFAWFTSMRSGSRPAAREGILWTSTAQTVWMLRLGVCHGILLPFPPCNWLAVKARLQLSDYNQETPVFTTNRYHGDLAWLPEEQPSSPRGSK